MTIPAPQGVPLHRTYALDLKAVPAEGRKDYVTLRPRSEEPRVRSQQEEEGRQRGWATVRWWIISVVEVGYYELPAQV